MTQNSNIIAKAVIVDWGTTSLRAALVDRDGLILEQVETERGIQFIKDNAFDAELLSTVEPWLEANGPLPVIALGMITSRNGWIEVPYVACPASPLDLAKGAMHRVLSNGSDIYFLAGISDKQRQPFPDVMRGEETQIVGYGLSDAAVIVLPGTHSKWARIGGGQIECFQTFVTGEMFALLSQHSFIAKAAGAVSDVTDWAAFEQGVRVIESAAGANVAFLSQVFSARTGMLANALNPAQIRDYVSGILIGSEFRQARDGGWFQAGDTVGIVGNDGLNDRYGRAAAIFDLSITDGGEQAAIKGALDIFACLKEQSDAAA